MKLTRRRKQLLLFGGLGLALLALAWTFPFVRLQIAISKWEAEFGPLETTAIEPTPIAETNASALELEALGADLGLCVAPPASKRQADCKEGAPDPEPWLERALALPNGSVPPLDADLERWLAENRAPLDAVCTLLLNDEKPSWSLVPWNPFDRSRHGYDGLTLWQQPRVLTLARLLAIDALSEHRSGRPESARTRMRAVRALIEAVSERWDGSLWTGVRIEHLRLAALRKIPTHESLEEASAEMPDFHALHSAAMPRSIRVLADCAKDAEHWEAWRDWEDAISGSGRQLGSERWPALLELPRGALAVADSIDATRRLHAWRAGLQCGDPWTWPQGFSTGGWRRPWWTSQLEGWSSTMDLDAALVFANLPFERDFTRAVLEAELHRAATGEWPKDGPPLLRAGRDCPRTPLLWFESADGSARLEVHGVGYSPSKNGLVYRGRVPRLDSWTFTP